MIVYLSTERFSTTIRGFEKYYRRKLGLVVRPLSYEELFFEGAGPIGHYIFSDFDRLSRYEIECAAAFANALQEAAPEARILNHPLKVLERYPLLLTLHKAGINDFTAIRLETGERPARYPVFIRAEDGYAGPETDLIHDDAQFDAALAELQGQGLPKRGRIAIGFANERSPDGFYRKYGAFNVDGRIVPHDLMFGSSWVVKIRFANTGWATNRDEDYGNSDLGVAEEAAYIRTNPHQELLKRAFELAQIDYGRADYGVVNGRVQVFEINTNPHLPWRPLANKRAERRELLERGLLEGFRSIDTPVGTRGRVRFSLPRPKAHNIHWPRRNLPISTVRKALNFVGNLG